MPIPNLQKTGRFVMSNSNNSTIKVSGKTITAIIVDAVIVLSFFVLLYSGVDFFYGGSAMLLLFYPLGISIATGLVIACIAETKHMSVWKWGVQASIVTLILMIMMLFFPSSLSGMAFIIAPVISLIFLPSMMGVGNENG